MAYFIFLKYLRSLEEFRKNPHVKIPPKSSTNFQSLDIFENQILFGKEFSFTFGPTCPAASRPFGPRSPPSRFFLLTAPAEHRLFLLPRRHAMDAAPSIFHAMELQRSPPPITPPSSIGRSYPPPFTPITAAMKAPFTATARHSRLPPPLYRPYKRVPALRWSTSPLHLASSPPQSCPRHGRLEPKLHRRCAASSPSPEIR
jgi:hypothetical protein